MLRKKLEWNFERGVAIRWLDGGAVTNGLIGPEVDVFCIGAGVAAEKVQGFSTPVALDCLNPDAT